MPKNSAAKIAANKRYNKKNVLQLKIGLNRKTDADVIEKIQSVDNKAGYIKKLVRDDIKKEEGVDHGS